jgi:hypothetical protein
VPELAARQQARLNLRRQLQILFERAPLPGAQAAQADADQRVCQKPVGLDGVVADLAQAVRLFVHARERGVHFAQKTAEPRRLFALDGRGLQPMAAFEKLLAHRRVNHGSHHLSPLTWSKKALTTETRRHGFNFKFEI